MKYIIIILLGVISSAAWADNNIQIINNCGPAWTVYINGEGNNCTRQGGGGMNGQATVATGQDCKNLQAFLVNRMNLDGSMGAVSCKISGKTVVLSADTSGKCTCSSS